MVTRRKVSAAFGALVTEIDQLRRLDDLNHARYSAGPGRPSVERLTKAQMFLLTEGILARAFSRYEEFLEQVFVLYCQGKPTISGDEVGSYLDPYSYDHAKQMLKANMTFLEWNDAEKVIARCQTYLYADSPIFTALTTHRHRLQNIRRVRNAIAHTSREAEQGYRRTLQDELGAVPLSTPKVGEFLLMRDRRAKRRITYLRSYLRVLRRTAEIASG